MNAASEAAPGALSNARILGGANYNAHTNHGRDIRSLPLRFTHIMLLRLLILLGRENNQCGETRVKKKEVVTVRYKEINGPVEDMLVWESHELSSLQLFFWEILNLILSGKKGHQERRNDQFGVSLRCQAKLGKLGGRMILQGVLVSIFLGASESEHGNWVGVRGHVRSQEGKQLEPSANAKFNPTRRHKENTGEKWVKIKLSKEEQPECYKLIFGENISRYGSLH
ncbi:hypothetical protein ACRRTK_012656 [Alexandromys fortis]